MTKIAQELDERLKRLDSNTAAAIERLVGDALLLVDTQTKRGSDDLAVDYHRTFLRQFDGVFAEEPFERPPQGYSEEPSRW